MKILAADIGGTNSRFALFDTSVRELVHCEIVSSRQESFLHVLDSLAKACPSLAPEESDFFALAVAGPVLGAERIQPSNLPYIIDVAEAREARGFGKAVLLNDFTAQAWACMTPAMSAATPLLPLEFAGKNASKIYAKPFSYPPEDAEKRHVPCALVGAGTGLGVAFLVAGPGDSVQVIPSEGGHAAFSFVGSEEEDFAAFALTATGLPYMRLDDIVTGRGLALLHEFLTSTRLQPEEIAALPDFKNTRTCALFARFYGRICRDIALTLLPGSGLVVTGGMAANTPHLVRHPAFCAEYLNAPGEHGELLADIPLWLNVNQLSGLWGAAWGGWQAYLAL